MATPTLPSRCSSDVTHSTCSLAGCSWPIGKKVSLFKLGVSLLSSACRCDRIPLQSDLMCAASPHTFFTQIQSQVYGGKVR